MTHRYRVGSTVHVELGSNSNVQGSFKIVSLLPIERGTDIRYRVKGLAETFERIVDEENISLG